MLAIIATIATALINDDEIMKTTDSESEDEDLNYDLQISYALTMMKETRGEVTPIKKLSEFVERIIPGYSRTLFKEHFR